MTEQPALTLYDASTGREGKYSDLVELPAGRYVLIGDAEDHRGTGSMALELLFKGGRPLPMAAVTHSTKRIELYLVPGVYRLSALGGVKGGSAELWLVKGAL